MKKICIYSVVLLSLASSASFAATSFKLDSAAVKDYTTISVTANVNACLQKAGSIDCKSYVSTGQLNKMPLDQPQVVKNLTGSLIPQINSELQTLANTPNLVNFSYDFPDTKGVRFTFTKEGGPDKTCYVQIDQGNYQQGKSITLPEDCK